MAEGKNEQADGRMTVRLCVGDREEGNKELGDSVANEGGEEKKKRVISVKEEGELVLEERRQRRRMGDLLLLLLF